MLQLDCDLLVVGMHQPVVLEMLWHLRSKSSESHDLRVAIGNILDFLGNDAIVVLMKKYVYHYHALRPAEINLQSEAFIFLINCTRFFKIFAFTNTVSWLAIC